MLVSYETNTNYSIIIMYLLIIDKYFKFIKQDIVYGVTNWFRNFFSMSNSVALIADYRRRRVAAVAFWT